MANQDISIKLNKSDVSKAARAIGNLSVLSTSKLNYLIDRSGMLIVRNMKVDAQKDTSNLVNNITYNAIQKSIISKAPYSAALENMTSSKEKGSVKGAYQFFWVNINRGLLILIMDLNNAIKRSLR